MQVDKEHEKLCTTKLTVDEVKKFRKAISEDYYFQVSFVPHFVTEHIAGWSLGYVGHAMIRSWQSLFLQLNCIPGYVTLAGDHALHTQISDSSKIAAPST